MHWVQSENRFERARRNEHEAVTEVCGREREWRLCVTFVVCARQVKAGDGTLKPLPTSLSAPLYFLFLCLFPQRRDKQTWLVADSSHAVPAQEREGLIRSSGTKYCTAIVCIRGPSPGGVKVLSLLTNNPHYVVKWPDTEVLSCSFHRFPTAKKNSPLGPSSSLLQ